MEPQPPLYLSAQDIGKVLSKLTQGSTTDSQEMKAMIAGRFEEIMGLIEADGPTMMLVHSCTKNPSSAICLKAFRESLLGIIIRKEMTGEEISKRAGDGDEEAEGDRLGKIGEKIQMLSLDNWHSSKNLAGFCTVAVEYIDAFIRYYGFPDNENEDAAGDEKYQDGADENESDKGNTISIYPYDMTILKVIVSAAQSYLEYLNTHKERLLEERDAGRWHKMCTLSEGLRGLSFQTEIAKGASTLEYKYFNTIVDLHVKWDVMAMEMGNLPGGDENKK